MRLISVAALLVFVTAHTSSAVSAAPPAALFSEGAWKTDKPIMLTVDYRKTAREEMRGAGFKGPEGFPFDSPALVKRGVGKKQIEIVLLVIDRFATTKEIAVAIYEKGLRPATVRELVAYGVSSNGIRWPDPASVFTIDSPTQPTPGYQVYAEMQWCSFGHERRLHGYTVNPKITPEHWFPRMTFAAVRD